jgi:regulator of nucleoside diphosphate kinase
VTSCKRLILTLDDAERLHRLAEQYDFGKHAAAIDFLEAELARADLVDAREVPSDVVKVGSRVVYADEDTGAEELVQVVWPHEAAPGVLRVSVLAPVGVALIGLREGDAIEFEVVRGRRRRLRVLRVLGGPSQQVAR